MLSALRKSFYSMSINVLFVKQWCLLSSSPFFWSSDFQIYVGEYNAIPLIAPRVKQTSTGDPSGELLSIASVPPARSLARFGGKNFSRETPWGLLSSACSAAPRRSVPFAGFADPSAKLENFPKFCKFLAGSFSAVSKRSWGVEKGRFLRLPCICLFYAPMTWLHRGLLSVGVVRRFLKLLYRCFYGGNGSRVCLCRILNWCD